MENNKSQNKTSSNKKTTKKTKTSKPKNIKKNKRTKSSIIISIIVFLLVGCVVGGYYFYNNYYITDKDNTDKDNTDKDNTDKDNTDKDNTDSNIDYSNFDYNNPNVASLIDNSKYNLTNNSVFYQYNKEEIKNYYISVDFSKNIDSIKDELFNLLKSNQRKVKYEGNNSEFNINKNWANYCLVDRNFVSSPLTIEEVNLGTWNRNVYMDILYQEEDYLFPKDGNTNKKLDREHILPKSYGFNYENEEYKNLLAGTDLHNLRSSDYRGNQTGHNDRFYNDVKNSNSNYSTCISNDGVTKTYYYDSTDSNGNKIGYFEPCDNEKGDIARSIFYMASRYYKYIESDSNGKESPALSIVENPLAKEKSTLSPIDTKDKPSEFGVLSILKKWNELDPVDEFEKTRNNLVYNLQGNRNPFVDYPSLVNLLF